MRWHKRRREAEDDCILDECKYSEGTYADGTLRHGYMVACVHTHGCGFRRHMFWIDETTNPLRDAEATP